MNYFKFSAGIFLVLAASRFIPHPPNFTSLLALSFYVPAILGIRFLPALVISFFITALLAYLQFLDTPGAASTTYSLGFWKHPSSGEVKVMGEFMNTNFILQEIAV